MRNDLLRVLMYHRIVDPRNAIGSNPSVISATPEGFAEQMRYAARHYRVVSAEQVLDAIRSGRSLPDNALLITFDDAYRDFLDAWSILRRLGLSATVFVPTAYPDHPERAFWWERLAGAITHTTRRSLDGAARDSLSLATPAARRATLRRLRMLLKQRPHAEAMRAVDAWCRELGEVEPFTGSVLSWDELRQLARDGVTLAPHTQTHPALTRLPLEQARAEICGSRDDLIRELGSVLPVFSYPFGLHDDAVVELVREAGFEMAVTCHTGYSRIGSADPLRLRRTHITTRTTPFLFRMRLTRYGCQLDRLRETSREWRAAAVHARAATCV